MTHPYTVIRRAVVSALRADPQMQALVNNRIWGSRVKRVKRQACPQVVVYINGDKSLKTSYGGDGQGPVECEATLVVEIVEATDGGGDLHGEDVEDRLDEIAEGVERLLDRFIVPTRMADEFRYQKTESGEFTLNGKDGEEIFVSRGVVYAVRFDRVVSLYSGDEVSSPTSTVDLTLEAGRIALPSGAVRVLAVEMDGLPMDELFDWQIVTLDGRQWMETISEGRIPLAAKLRVHLMLDPVAAPIAGVYLGAEPLVGAANLAAYEKVEPI